MRYTHSGMDSKTNVVRVSGSDICIVNGIQYIDGVPVGNSQSNGTVVVSAKLCGLFKTVTITA